MRLRDWPTVLGLLVFALTAVACAGFMIAIANVNLYAVTGAILVLATGQVAFILVWSWRSARFEDRFAHQDEIMQSSASAHGEITARIDELEHRLAHPQSGRLDEIATELRALRDHIKFLAYPAEAPRPQPSPAAEPRKAAAAERLDLLLEPVIEMATGATAHYRALLNLTDEHDHVVAHHELMDKSDKGGMRAALDLHLLKQVAPVLRRLRMKQPGLRIFVPLGAATLAGRAELARITDILREETDIAGGLVFEITQELLGALDMTGIESLAALGRLGATMSLNNVAAEGLDLASLRQLGVRFLGISASAFNTGFGQPPGWRDFVQYARAMQFLFIATEIATAQQATAAAQTARYGSGIFFAPPRKVRSDAGAAQGQRRAQAA